jgi:CRISPR-associated exonuclease Cas4
VIELRASDLRQYLYCPRVVYFSLVVPVDRVETFKMSAGCDAEREHARLERRRGLARYALADGIRRFDVPVSCAKLGVSGIVDEVVYGPEGPAPVEIKRTEGGVALGHKVQLAVYGMGLEEQIGQPVPKGFIHLVPRKQTWAVALDDKLRAAASDVTRRIRAMLTDQEFPPPADRPAKCDGCELRCFCNDIY